MCAGEHKLSPFPWLHPSSHDSGWAASKDERMGVSQGGLSPTLQSQFSVASVWPASLPTSHFLGPGIPMEEQRARKGEPAWLLWSQGGLCNPQGPPAQSTELRVRHSCHDFVCVCVFVCFKSLKLDYLYSFILHVCMGVYVCTQHSKYTCGETGW